MGSKTPTLYKSFILLGATCCVMNPHCNVESCSTILGVRIGPALQYHECCRRWRPRIMEESPFSSIPFAHSGNSLPSISVGHAPHTQTPLLSFEAERTKRKRHPRTICSTIPLHEILPKSESIGKRISRKNELRRMRVVVRFIRSAASGHAPEGHAHFVYANAHRNRGLDRIMLPLLERTRTQRASSMDHLLPSVSEHYNSSLSLDGCEVTSAAADAASYKVARPAFNQTDGRECGRRDGGNQNSGNSDATNATNGIVPFMWLLYYCWPYPLRSSWRPLLFQWPPSWRCLKHG